MSHKTKLDTFNNEWYSPGSYLKRMLWYITNLLFFKSHWFVINSFKVFLLRIFGAKVGRGVVIKPGVSFKYPWRLSVGNHVWFGEDVWVDNLGKVTIQDHVCISQGAMLLTGNHNFKKSSFDLMIGDIVLESGVWIGAKSIVCPGVTCFSHAVLTVNSVASNDLNAFSIYSGTPAVYQKQRTIAE